MPASAIPLNASKSEKSGRPLPNLSHLSRVPTSVSVEQLIALCATAHLNPLACASTRKVATADERLDAQNFVLLRKAVGQKQALWMAPEYVAEAVSIDPTLYTQEYADAGRARLDAAGFVQEGGRWHLRRRRNLRVRGVDFEVTRRAAATAQEVALTWQNTDCPLTEPAFDDLPLIQATLEELVQQGQDSHPAQAKGLYPVLRRALGASRDSQSFKTAASAAYAEWERYAKELDALAELSSTLALARYPHSFPAARTMRRDIELFIGPPNSGKTYQAFQELKSARAGVYLAPLRLLALEGRDRLVAAGAACSLLTGEERDIDPEANLTSSTVEMLNPQRVVDVAVIDEAQMLFDPFRGWAWTQALVAAPARRVIVICSAYAAPAVQALLKACGETARIRQFERKQHVEVLRTPVALRDVQPGDALVAFSRREVLQLRDQVEAAGRRVAVIYGALPPEVRRREAERFAEGEAHVLVATDAIGMGLNLPIKRVLFSTMKKYDGFEDRPLETTEIHQIAGRAGRFGMQEEGFTGVLATSEKGALKVLERGMAAQPQAPEPFKARVAPNAGHVDVIADRLKLKKLHPVLVQFVQNLALENEDFEVASLDQMLELALQLDMFAADLPLEQRFVYAQAPVDIKSTAQVESFLAWARGHAKAGKAGQPLFARAVDEFSPLVDMEQALRQCTLWLWLDLRFAGVYGHLTEVHGLRDELNRGIERKLRSKKPLAAAPRR